jgi:tetratricopeptide (TPR) repeat protein
VINQIGLSVEQSSTLPSVFSPAENRPYFADWATLLAARNELVEQVETACYSLARGVFDLADEQFQVLLQVALTDGDSRLAEAACHNLATALRQSGQWLAAEVWQQQSLAWRSRKPVNSSWQSDDELARLASDLTGRGCDAFLKREWDIAESLWRRALAIEEWRGSREGRATDSGNLGLLAAARGELESGTRWLRKSLRLHRLMLDDIGIGTDLVNLAEIYRLQGRFSRMTRTLQQAANRFQRAEAQRLLELVRRRLKEADRIEAVLRCDVRRN